MHIGIAGAGLIGRLLAWQLVQAGHDVTLFDRDDVDGQQSCAFVAAGMLCPITELAIAETIIYDLGIHSLSLWPKLLATLTTPVFFQQTGSLLVAHRQDKAELERLRQLVQHKLAASAADIIQPLSPSAAQQLEPELKLNQFAYYLPVEGQLDNQGLLRALASELQPRIAWHTHTPVSRLAERTIVTGVQDFTFDIVVDCRGLGAQADFTDLRGVRGEIIYVHAPEVRLTRPIRLLHPRYCTYIVPKPGQIFAIGASEIESEDTSPISVRTTLELLSAAYAVHPGFAEARIIQTYTQLRPTFADQLPKVIFDNGVVRINGLFRHGFLLAPALIEQALSLIC
jgi:glycine oxidase